METTIRATTGQTVERAERDRKSTRLNSSHDQVSYAVFCLKKTHRDALETLGERRVRDLYVHDGPGGRPCLHQRREGMDQLPSLRSDDAGAEDALVVRVDDQLEDARRLVGLDGPRDRGEGQLRHLVPQAPRLRLALGEPDPGNLRIGEHH